MQAVGRAVVRVGKAKVGTAKGVAGVFQGDDGFVGASRCIIHRGHAQGHGGGVATACAITDGVGEAGRAGVVGVGRKDDVATT